MPKMVHFGEFLKICSLHSNSVTRQVTFNRTEFGGKCLNSNATFWVVFKQCGCQTFILWWKRKQYSWVSTYLFTFKGNVDDCHTPHTNIKMKAQVWRKPHDELGFRDESHSSFCNHHSCLVWKSKWRSRFCSKEGEEGLFISLFKHW